MSTSEFTKASWTDLFREIGLDDATMHRWHATFERRWPAAHKDFLVWLKVPHEDIDRIRDASRGAWAEG